MTAPNPAPPADPPAPAPRGAAARKCVNCSAVLADGQTFCPGCGVKVEGGRPRDVKLVERVAALEESNTKLAPLAALLDRMRAAGLDPEELDEPTLRKAAAFKSLAKGGLGAQIAAGMRGMFPGLPFGAGDDEAPDAPGDEP